MLVNMADHNGPGDIPILKGTLQMMTTCIQRMHLSITLAEELAKAVLEAAMTTERLKTSLEAEKEGRRIAKMEVFRLSKVITSAEKSKEAAIGFQAQLEGKVAELEAVIGVMAAERLALEAKHWQQGWDEAGAAYKEEGWTRALTATQIPEESPLFQDIPIPSKSLGLKAAAAPATPLAKISPGTDFATKTLESDAANETVNVKGGDTLETEDVVDVVKEAPIF
ncbi:hypothetical protein CsSME_00030233 [Camellia sinensis var. sinensis]